MTAELIRIKHLGRYDPAKVGRTTSSLHSFRLLMNAITMKAATARVGNGDCQAISCFRGWNADAGTKVKKCARQVVDGQGWQRRSGFWYGKKLIRHLVDGLVPIIFPMSKVAAVILHALLRQHWRTSACSTNKAAN